MDPDESLPKLFRRFAEISATRSPLYARLAASIAGDADILALLRPAPEVQQRPVLLFAVVHSLLIGGAGAELAAHYPSLTAVPDSGDPFPAFRRFCLSHQAAIAERVATHTTQTNEIGRCALLLPAFEMAAEEMGAVAHIDVGASAGLNLLLPRYRYSYEPGGTVGDGPITLDCATRGNPPIPKTIPAVAASIGIDVAPVDLNDEASVNWLRACVWADQADRFARLGAAVALARDVGVDVRRGNAVGGLGQVVAEAARLGHPVITTTWVLNYLTQTEQAEFVTGLDRIAGTVDLTWIAAESPAETPGLPFADWHGEERTVLTMTRWRDGMRTTSRLAVTHPHGYWLHWSR